MISAAAGLKRFGQRRAAFLAAVAVVFTTSGLWGRRVDAPPARLDSRGVAPLVGATELPEKVKGPFPYWRIRRGEEVLFAAESRAAARDIMGYGGPFNILVVINAEGNIDRVVIVSHRETPSYLAGAKEFLRSFAGLPADAAFVPGRDIDVITRATVSSSAFAAAVRATGRALLRAALGRDVVLPAKRRAWDWKWAAVIAVFYIAAAWVRRRPPEWLRVAMAAAAAGILGFWAGRFISLGDVGRFVLWRFPPWAENLSLYTLLPGAILLALVVGNVYCGWLCPFGAAAELLYKIPLPKITAPAPFVRKLTAARVVVLAAAMAFIVASRDAGVAAYEPFDDIFARVAAAWSLVFLLVVLAASAVHYRFFCRYLCAVGALLAEVTAAGRRSFVGPGAASGDAAANCPTFAIKPSPPRFDAALCIECGRCRRRGIK